MREYSTSRTNLQKWRHQQRQSSELLLPSEESPSLNECLEAGPPLPKLLWNALVRNRVKSVALTADIKQAFLQVRIRAEDRDVLRFHLINNKDPSTIEVLIFTRVLFGLVKSSFLLAGTLKLHLQKLKNKVPCIS